MWAEGDVRVESDPQDTGVSFEWEGGIVENVLWCRVGLSFVRCEWDDCGFMGQEKESVFLSPL